MNKADPVQIARVAGKLWPAIRMLAAALSRASDGGKRVTAAELDGILITLFGGVMELVGDVDEARDPAKITPPDPGHR